MLNLTSEVKVAQMVCNNLLSGLLSTQFDSAWKKDASFPSSDNCRALTGYPYIRDTNYVWKPHRVLAIRQVQVSHRGTFQCCI